MGEPNALMWSEETGKQGSRPSSIVHRPSSIWHCEAWSPPRHLSEAIGLLFGTGNLCATLRSCACIWWLPRVMVPEIPWWIGKARWRSVWGIYCAWLFRPWAAPNQGDCLPPEYDTGFPDRCEALMSVAFSNRWFQWCLTHRPRPDWKQQCWGHSRCQWR